MYFNMPLNHMHSIHSITAVCYAVSWGVSAIILPHEAVQERKQLLCLMAEEPTEVVSSQVRRGGTCCVMYKILVWSCLLSHCFCGGLWNALKGACECWSHFTVSWHARQGSVLAPLTRLVPTWDFIRHNWLVCLLQKGHKGNSVSGLTLLHPNDGQQHAHTFPVHK